MSNLTVYQDPEVAALKLELVELEKQLNQLHNKRDDYLALLDDYNRLYLNKAGEIIDQILYYQMLLAQLNAKQDPDEENENIFFEAQQAYQEYHEDYQKYQEYQEYIEEHPPVHLNKENTKTLKKAFQQASKLCHPDMVVDELKEQATQVFQVLSDAYQKKDLLVVQEILENLKSEGIFTQASEKIDNKEILKQRIQLIKERILTIQDEIESIKQDETDQIIEELNGDYEAYLDHRAGELNLELKVLKQLLQDNLDKQP